MTSTAPSPPPVNGYDPESLRRIRESADQSLAERYKADRERRAAHEAEMKKLRDYYDEAYRNRQPNLKSIAAAERYNANLRVRAAHDQAIQASGAPAAPAVPLDTKAIVARIQKEAAIVVDAKARRLRYKKDVKAARVKANGDLIWAARRLEVQSALVRIAEDNARTAKRANARILRLEKKLSELPENQTQLRAKLEAAISTSKLALRNAAAESPEETLAGTPMGNLLQYV